MQPTAGYGEGCQASLIPELPIDKFKKPHPSFILNCGYPGAYHALQHLYGDIRPPPSFSAPYQGSVVAFNQYQYLPSVYDAVAGRASGRSLLNDSCEESGHGELGWRQSRLVGVQVREGGSSFDPNGYLYVPPNCKTGDRECKLHVVFHGTFMGG